jgi:hypothetical protein
MTNKTADQCPYGQKDCPGGAACTCALPPPTSNLRSAAQAVLDHAQPANYAADYVMVHRSIIGTLRAALASSPETKAPQGDWLWCKLMDWCRKRGVHPRDYNDLFAIVSDARGAQKTS